MPKHKSEDYKLSAVEYYLESGDTMRKTCEIYKCSYQSLERCLKRYEKEGHIKRKKTIKNPYKTTKEIEEHVLLLVKKNVNITIWEISKLVHKKYKVRLNDKTIFNILKKYKITRKRLRSKYYPEKKIGQESKDLETL